MISLAAFLHTGKSCSQCGAILLSTKGLFLASAEVPCSFNDSFGHLLHALSWRIRSICVSRRFSSRKFPPVIRMIAATVSVSSGCCGRQTQGGTQCRSNNSRTSFACQRSKLMNEADTREELRVTGQLFLKPWHPNQVFVDRRSRWFLPRQSRQPEFLIKRRPTLSGARRYSSRGNDRLQRALVFQGRLGQPERSRASFRAYGVSPASRSILEEYAK
jgi:hypothetical protein